MGVSERAAAGSGLGVFANVGRIVPGGVVIIGAFGAAYSGYQEVMRQLTSNN